MKILVIATGAALLAVGSASASSIVSPITVLQNTAGEFTAGAEVENAFNGSGITPAFTSGVTDFDTYIGMSPTHTRFFGGVEWFSTSNGFVDLDFGATLDFTRVAIWNEEGANGVGSFSISAASDATFTVLTALGSFNPALNPEGSDYGAEVFDLADATARYLRVDFTGASGGGVFGLGEMAFEAATMTPIPLPGGFPLLLGAAAGLALLRRRAT